MARVPHRNRISSLVLAVAATGVLAGCVTASPTGGGGPLGVEPDDGKAPILSPLAAVATTVPPRDCSPQALRGELAVVENPTLATLRLSQAIYPCADEVVVASTAPADIVAASAHALARGAGLLVVDTPPSPEQIAELSRLDPKTVRVFGVDAATLGGAWQIVDPITADPASSSTTTTPANPTTTAVEPNAGDAADHIWLIGADSPLATAVAPAAASAGVEIVEVDVADLRGLDAETRARIGAAETTRLIGTFGPDASWQLDVVRSGVEIPGGGQLVFPGRRFVALYGNPLTPALGVLGEQGPDATLDRVREVAASYETGDGVTVVPTFEIITTVASAQAGADNDYSAEMAIEDLRPWVDLAAGQGVYVVLDLQPGRTDFLTQAKRYEELLRLPHVGLALDPEWRLKPDQVHLRQIGTVTAAEINTVSEWLAGIVREEALPQKLFVVHQFRFSMITERETIQAPPELAVVIQMDGQGPLSTKYETYDVLTAGTENAVWRWGWKNFYDEDSPTATPEQTLAVDPEPVFVSYQ